MVCRKIGALPSSHMSNVESKNMQATMGKKLVVPGVEAIVTRELRVRLVEFRSVPSDMKVPATEAM